MESRGKDGVMRVYRDRTDEGVSYQVYFGHESFGPFSGEDLELDRIINDNDFDIADIITCDWRE
jgi:hypothetical protein